jgi:hypothetical protein
VKSYRKYGDFRGKYLSFVGKVVRGDGREEREEKQIGKEKNRGHR